MTILPAPDEIRPKFAITYVPSGYMTLYLDSASSESLISVWHQSEPVLQQLWGTRQRNVPDKGDVQSKNCSYANLGSMTGSPPDPATYESEDGNTSSWIEQSFRTFERINLQQAFSSVS